MKQCCLCDEKIKEGACHPILSHVYICLIGQEPGQESMICRTLRLNTCSESRQIQTVVRYWKTIKTKTTICVYINCARNGVNS